MLESRGVSCAGVQARIVNGAIASHHRSFIIENSSLRANSIPVEEQKLMENAITDDAV